MQVRVHCMLSLEIPDYTNVKVNNNWGLAIMGYGKIENKLEKIVKEENIEDVYFLRVVEQYDLLKIYTACDCLILPSTEEVWGLVVNEALYSG